MKVCLLLYCLIYGGKGYTILNETKLHEDIFKNYDRGLRPGENRSMPTEIGVFFYMTSLKELVESDGKIGIVGTLGLEWTDVRLGANPLWRSPSSNYCFCSCHLDAVYSPLESI